MNLRAHIHMAIEVGIFLGLPGISLTQWDTLAGLFEQAEDYGPNVKVYWQQWSDGQLHEPLPSISLLEL